MIGGPWSGCWRGHGACGCVGLASGFVVVSASTSSLLLVVSSLAFLLYESCSIRILHHNSAVFFAHAATECTANMLWAAVVSGLPSL